MDWSVLEGNENEHNWQKREELLKGLAVQLEGKTIDDDAISIILKMHLFNVLDIVHTPRTQLALTTCRFLRALILAVADIEGYAELLWKEAVKICGVTKKLIASAGEEVIETLFSRLQPQRILSFVEAGTRERNAAVRERVLQALIVRIRQVNPAEWSLKQIISELTNLIERCVHDSSPTVRSHGAHLFMFVKKESSEDAQYLMNHFDASTGKKLRQLLTKLEESTTTNVKKKDTVSPMRMEPESSGEIKEDLVVERLSIDEEISIPLKSMSICDSPKPSIFQSKIPIRSPPKLVLTTPFKRYLTAQPSDSPFKKEGTSVNDILCRVSANINDLDLWKLLLKYVRNQPLLDNCVIGAIEECIHNHYLKLTDETVTFAGLILQITAKAQLPSTIVYVQNIIWLSSSFAQNQSIWGTHPFLWNSCTDTLDHISSHLINASSAYHSAGIDGLALACDNRQHYSTIVLENIYRIWTLGVDSNVSKSIVIFLTSARRYLGDQRFFFSLPNISLSHRRLLDAYLSIDS